MADLIDKPTPAAEPVGPVASVANREELKLMIKFPPFHHGGKTYDLSHLDPHAIQFIKPGTATLPAIVYNVNLMFTQHTFTITLPGSRYDRTLEHKDGREIRLFDVERWELSKCLPALVREMASARCHHANENNFVTTEMLNIAGRTVTYHIYFAASKAQRPKYINLLIQSAYENSRKPSGKPVNFLALLHAVQTGKKLRL